MVVLGELFDSPELDLIVKHQPGDSRTRSVRIVHASEVPGIEAWLRGGEVLLTVGTLLDLTDPDICADYAARVRASGAAALGVGLGSTLPHTTVPDALIRAAEHERLALFGVPEHVAFVDVVDAFTTLREAEYARELHAVASAQRAIAGLLAGPGMERAIESLRGHLGAEAAVINPAGAVIAGGLGTAALVETVNAAVRAAFADTAKPHSTELAGLTLYPIGTPVIAWLAVHESSRSRRPFSARARDLVITTSASLLHLTLSSPEPTDASIVLNPNASLPERRATWELANPGANTELRLLRIGNVPAVPLLRLVSWLPGTAGTAGGEGASAIVCGPRAYPRVLRIVRQAGGQVLEDVESDLESAAHTAAAWFGGAEAHAELEGLLGEVADEAAARFADRVLGPLSAVPAAWVATLRTAARLGQTGEGVAAELGVHRHTVRTHLNKLGELLGRDLRDPEQLRLMHIAFHLRERNMNTSV